MFYQLMGDSALYQNTFAGVQPVYGIFLRTCKFICGSTFLDSVAILQLTIGIISCLFITHKLRLKNNWLKIASVTVLIFPIITWWQVIMSECMAYSLMLFAFGFVQNKRWYFVFALLSVLTRTQMAFMLLPYIFNKRFWLVGIALACGFWCYINYGSGTINRLRPIANFVVDREDVEKGLYPKAYFDKFESMKLTYKTYVQPNMRADQFYDANFAIYMIVKETEKTSLKICLNHKLDILKISLGRIIGMYKDMRVCLLIIPLALCFFPCPQIKNIAMLNVGHIIIIQFFSSVWHDRYAFYVQNISLFLIIAVLGFAIKHTSESKPI